MYKKMSSALIETLEHEFNYQRVPPQPLVSDFVKYYPWACGQFQMGFKVIVKKIVQRDYGSTLSVGRHKHTKSVSALRVKSHLSVMHIESQYNLTGSVELSNDPIVKIYAVYLFGDRLIQLKFEKTSDPIPRYMLLILKLIAKFHTHLTSISFKNKISQEIIYDLAELSKISTITEVCLDGCYVKEGNYAQLLDEKCALKVLSLARCSLTDSIVTIIAEKLHHLHEGSKHLMILNLSSNKITDVGAEALARALRTNRKLCHLNLADNFMTDEGAFKILDTMLKFSISMDELIEVRGRRFQYLSNKIELFRDFVDKLTKEYKEKAEKRRLLRPKPALKLRLRKYLVFEYQADEELVRIRERANYLAENMLGPFDDPFFPCSVNNGIASCFGNNTLQSLNLAYNNLSVLSVKKILKVMLYQSRMDRKPKGLINVNIEGNLLPLYCQELSKINDFIKIRDSQPKITKR